MNELSSSPSVNGSNDRGPDGRFRTGNAGGPGNPHVRHTARLRATLLKSVTVADLRDVVKTLVRQAKSGDLTAIRELFDRLLGRPVASLPDGEAPGPQVLIVRESPGWFSEPIHSPFVPNEDPGNGHRH